MRWLTAILILLCAASPAAAATEQQRLDEARAKWRAAGISDYAYTFRDACFCPPPRTQEVVVRGGIAEQGRTVEQLFDLVQREIDRPAADLSVTYDAIGVPVQMSVDRYAYVVDDEYAFRVENFRTIGPPPPPPPPPPGTELSPLEMARAAWKASGIRRHRLVVTRRCGGRRAHVRRDWTVPRLHAFIARRPGAAVTYGRYGIPRTIVAGGCRYRVTRFRRGR